MPTHTSWIEVDSSALRHNLAQVKGLVGPGMKVMAVVKADAYGHGAVVASKVFSEAGADYLAVTTLEEGLQIRDAGVETPVLVFSPLLPDQMGVALESGLEQTICDIGLAQALSEVATKLEKQAAAHVKIDTGMGRLGIDPSEAASFVYSLLRLPGIRIAGVYTHFADAGSKNLIHARAQNARFAEVIELLRSKDMPTGLCHAANSSALLNMPEAHYDMVRPGTILYGQYPTRDTARKLDLKDTWCFKTRIVALRKLAPGAKVGYGSESTTKRQTTAAVIPVGYADGFTVIPESIARRSSSPLRQVASALLGGSTSPHVTIAGKRAPVIGRVSMQMCSVDVTDIPDVRVGDEVLIPARRVTTSSRIPRVYSG